MKEFERTIVSELILSSGNNEITLLRLDKKSKVEFSASGYFVTYRDTSFPTERLVLDKPDIRGELDGVKVGYVAFVENHELTLECYSYENELIEANRDGCFERSKT